MSATELWVHYQTYLGFYTVSIIVISALLLSTEHDVFGSVLLVVGFLSGSHWIYNTVTGWNWSSHMETILLIIFSWWFIVGLLVVGTFVEQAFDSYVIPIICTLAIIGILYHRFDLSLGSLAILVVSYLIAGIVWSFWRFHVFVNDEIAGFNRGLSPEIKADPARAKRELDRLKRDLNPRQHVSEIVAWIVIWPISALGHVLTDLIRFLEKLVREYLVKGYELIVSRALRRLEITDKPKQ